nr:hypothetical protein [uncultured Celeribacter sp.]
MSYDEETSAYSKATTLTFTITDAAKEIDGLKMVPGGARTKAVVGIGAEVLGQSEGGFDVKDGFEG